MVMEEKIVWIFCDGGGLRHSGFLEYF